MLCLSGLHYKTYAAVWLHSILCKKYNVINTGREIINPVSRSWRACWPNHSRLWICPDHSSDPGWEGRSCAAAGCLVSSLAAFTELLLMTRRSRSSLFSIWTRRNIWGKKFRCRFWQLNGSTKIHIITYYQKMQQLHLLPETNVSVTLGNLETLLWAVITGTTHIYIKNSSVLSSRYLRHGYLKTVANPT